MRMRNINSQWRPAFELYSSEASKSQLKLL